MRIRIIILSLFLSFTISAQVPFGFFGGGVAEAISMFVNHKSITLDGVNQYATVADADDLSFTQGDTLDLPFSVSMWVYTAKTASEGLIVKGNTLANEEYEIILASIPIFRIFTDGSNYTGKQGGALTKNKWEFLTFTYDGRGGASAADGLNIYLNAVNVTGATSGSGTYAGMTNKAGLLYFGDMPRAGNYELQGSQDQVTIWDKELSLSEIKEAMAMRDLSYHSAYANIVSWWEFDDADVSGSTVSDRVGANDATMVNTPTRTQGITYPYSYSLYNSASFDSLTLMQSADATAFGGFGIDLDGTTEYLTTPDNALLSRGDGATDNPLSFYAVVNADDFTNFQICEKSGEYQFFVNASDQLEVRFTDASTGGYIGRLYSTPITGWEGQTVVLMATKTGTTAAGIDLYFNGLVVDDVDANSGAYTAMEDGAGAFRMGYNGTTYGNGRIGDVGFLDVEATAAQALTLYNEHGDVDLRDTDVSGDLIVYYNGYNSTSATATDLSANGLNSTFTNGDVADIQYNPTRQIFESDSSGSFEFDGVNQYVTTTDNINTYLSTNDTTTFSMWFNTTSTANTYFGYYFNANNQMYVKTFASGTLYFRFKYFNVTKEYYVTTTAWNDGEWHNATFLLMKGNTVDEFQITVDGVIRPITITLNQNPDIIFQDGVLNIGSDGTANYMTDNISHLGIISGKLTESEALEIYNNGSPVDPRLTTIADRVISHYRLNQGDSPTATDGILDIVGSNPATGVNTPTISTTSYPTN